MATKEGAERACVNKRPIIDGRRANVDLAYLGAKPKATTEGAATDSAATDGTATPERPSAPSSPTGRQADVDLTNPEAKPKSGQDHTATPECPSASPLAAPFEMVSTTDSGSAQYASEEHFPNYSTVQNRYKYESGHPAQLKPTRVSSMQSVTPNPPLIYYQGNIPPYSPAGSAALLDPNFLDQTTPVNFVTFMPAQGSVAPPIQNTNITMQYLPHFGQFPPRPSATELVTNPPFIYSVPMWYVEQGGLPCGPVSLEPMSRYSQTSLISAEFDGNNNGGFSACKMYPIPSYY